MKFTQRLAIGYVQTKFKLLSVISKKRTAEKAFDIFATPILKSVRKEHLKNAETIHLIIHNKKTNRYK